MKPLQSGGEQAGHTCAMSMRPVVSPPIMVPKRWATLSMEQR